MCSTWLAQTVWIQIVISFWPWRWRSHLPAQQNTYLVALRNNTQCIFVVPVFMTSQSLPVKLMELNCKIYFWIEKGKRWRWRRRTTTTERWREKKKKESTEYDTNSITCQCLVHTCGHRERKLVNWWQWWQPLLQRPESVSLLKFI